MYSRLYNVIKVILIENLCLSFCCVNYNISGNNEINIKITELLKCHLFY